MIVCPWVLHPLLPRLVVPPQSAEISDQRSLGACHDRQVLRVQLQRNGRALLEFLADRLRQEQRAERRIFAAPDAFAKGNAILATTPALVAPLRKLLAD